ncbi:MAG: tetratricopeptide repeat protein [Verrucomicrobiota bacterium]
MRLSKIKLVFIFLGLAALIIFLKRPWVSSPRVTVSPSAPGISFPPAKQLPSDEAAFENLLRFYVQRLQRDPEDYSAQSKLAACYLQRVHETSNEDFLALAKAAAVASLASVAAERNTGGLFALTRAEFANHEFSAARDHALQLTRLAPDKGFSYAILGDALLELGNYDEAIAAFLKMEQLDPGSVETETRLARWATLHGKADDAQKHFAKTLFQLLEMSAPPRETVAWVRWQLGETAFAIGDYKNAERQYRDALITFPNYARALASLGRLRAAGGDLREAMTHYQQAIQSVRAPDFVAALGDLYQLEGNEKLARQWFKIVEELGQHSLQIHGTTHNRQLALFHADHDLKIEESFTNAVSEYAVRKDVYGADALAWTAFKSGRLTEAQAAIKEALRLGTQDAKLFYHAGMISLAAGQKSVGVDYLKRALALNPGFDPLQFSLAKKALQKNGVRGNIFNSPAAKQ